MHKIKSKQSVVEIPQYHLSLLYVDNSRCTRPSRRVAENVYSLIISQVILHTVFCCTKRGAYTLHILYTPASCCLGSDKSLFQEICYDMRLRPRRLVFQHELNCKHFKTLIASFYSMQQMSTASLHP